MSTPEAELRRVWHRIAGRRHESVLDTLLGLLREPHRRYHTAAHVMWVCRHVDDLAQSEPVDDVDAILMAALFHDAVYDPRSSSNEHDSARLALHLLAAIPGWEDARRRRAVEHLVLATASHTADAESTSAATPVRAELARSTDVLLDADLAILGADPAAYEAYRVGVRTEYDHVDDDSWRVGRSAVLRGFLERPAIYSTETMRTRREARAHANLSAELASLGGRGQ